MKPPGDHQGLRGVARRIRANGKWIVEREELPQEKPQTPSHRSVPNPTGWLTDRESLPTISQSVEAHGRFWPWLISSEPLPIATFDHKPDAGSFFRWLFAADQPATAQQPVPTKEASSDES